MTDSLKFKSFIDEERNRQLEVGELKVKALLEDGIDLEALLKSFAEASSFPGLKIEIESNDVLKNTFKDYGYHPCGSVISILSETGTMKMLGLGYDAKQDLIATLVLTAEETGKSAKDVSFGTRTINDFFKELAVEVGAMQADILRIAQQRGFTIELEDGASSVAVGTPRREGGSKASVVSGIRNLLLRKDRRPA